MRFEEITACLNTKDSYYPREVLEHTASFPFGEILVLTHSDSPYRKYELFKKAKFDYIYYSDDDAICPIQELLNLSKPDMINIAMKPGHFTQYENMRMTMGLGWGSIFPKKMLDSLHLYTDKYGEDELFKREAERILTYLNYPQNRLVLPIQDLPSAMAPDRLWRQPGHYENIQIVEERCKTLV